jgi:hypothetical protein
MSHDDDQQKSTPSTEREGPDTADDGPVQTRKTPEGASPDRQIAQEPQQSTGLGMGQS